MRLDFDYRNSVLVGLSGMAYLFRWLQSVMNAAARLIYNLRPSDHITEALISLHWLHSLEWVPFKVVLPYTDLRRHSRVNWFVCVVSPIYPVVVLSALHAPVFCKSRPSNCLPGSVARPFQLLDLLLGTISRAMWRQLHLCRPFVHVWKLFCSQSLFLTLLWTTPIVHSTLWVL